MSFWDELRGSYVSIYNMDILVSLPARQNEEY
jgi:hypothetical protein